MRGAITQHDEGNAALRLMVGFGAGSVNFNARVEVVDGVTGAKVGDWVVDKNSWALGGALAASQRPEDFMASAADKIGKEIAAKRRGPSPVAAR